jgi:hypothetical protein
MRNAMQRVRDTGLFQRYLLGELGGKLGVLTAVVVPLLLATGACSAPVIALCELSGYYGCILLRETHGLGLLMRTDLGEPAGALAGSVLADALFYALVTLTVLALRARRHSAGHP